MNKLSLISLVILAFWFVMPGQVRAVDRYKLIPQARYAAEQGRQTEALEKYSEYIATHPAVTGRRAGSYKRNSQYYLRNLLIAFSGQIELQRGLGRDSEVQKSLNHLKRIHKENFFGSKNLYSLAEIYKKNGAVPEAVAGLNTIISDQQRSPKRTNNKVFIRACKSLIELSKAAMINKKVDELLSLTADSLKQFEFDLKDRYEIGVLLLENGDTKLGEEILYGIIDNIDLENLSGEENAIVNTALKLIGINSSDTEATSRIVAKLDKFSEFHELSPRNQYSLGIACLNSGQEKRGLLLLERVKHNHPETTFARKALFVLSRVAASASDWDRAIKNYSEYIEKYPEPRFFSLKAYSRLIDCYWAKYKRIEFIDTEVSRLADIANDIADFETQLNMARDLKDKGYDDLAEATFSLGLSEARFHLQMASGGDERLRILLLLQKYAFPLEKFSLVEEFAREVLDLLDAPGIFESKSSEKSRYIKSQSYIWLAQVYQKTNREDDAVEAYSNFLTEFQDSRDVNYVRFALAEIYEGKGNLAHAKKQYEKIDDGVWKDKANRKLNDNGLIQ